MYGAATLAMGQVSTNGLYENRSGVFELYGSVICLITVEEACAFMRTDSKQQSGPRADRRLVSDDVGGRQPEEGRAASQNGSLYPLL